MDGKEWTACLSGQRSSSFARTVSGILEAALRSGLNFLALSGFADVSGESVRMNLSDVAALSGETIIVQLLRERYIAFLRWYSVTSAARWYYVTSAAGRNMKTNREHVAQPLRP